MSDNKPSPSKDSKDTKLSMVGLSFAAGMFRGIVGFPVEHPFEAVKTQWQADPKHRNEWRIFRDIVETKGYYRGFYAGSLPNLGRIMLK